jgi:arabinan endo-1,5-alpha-L-arabinosidase
MLHDAKANARIKALLRFRREFICFVVWIAVCQCACTGLAQVGDVTGVHDPSIIQSGDVFYLFATGKGVTERTSTDLFHWKRAGRVLAQNPAWTSDYITNGQSMWAPDISFINGEYRLYYAVSSFGKTSSAIGLSVNKTLDGSSPDYRWVDRGKVIATPAHNNWNAIDPCAFEDAKGNAWMVLGSCWSGLKLVQLDPKTGLLAEGDHTPEAVASYPPGNLIEEGYIRRHGDYCYLWESVDHCCRGVDSTYRILVGRSSDVRGPYLDRNGTPMLRGGGTLVLASYDNVRGPGSCAIVRMGDREFLIHHEYDGNRMGTPTLNVRQLFWAEDGWPVAGEPIVRPPGERPSVAKSLAGDWSVRSDFGAPRRISLALDGTISPAPGTWRMEGSRLKLSVPKAAKLLVETDDVSDDQSFFVGRNEDGVVVTGVRMANPSR